MSDISRFPIPDLSEMPEDIRERIESISEKSGFVPNVFLALAWRPDEFRAFFAHHDALMERDSGLTKAEREMIVVATSSANACHYCVIAHGAILRIRAKAPLLADQIAINYLKAELTDRQQLMLEFALLIASDSASVTQEDLESMYKQGFTQDDVWDIGAITAFFAMSNRLANFSGMQPNEQFYTLGRT